MDSKPPVRYIILALIATSLYSSMVGYFLGHEDGWVTGFKVGKIEQKICGNKQCFLHNGVPE